jgi:parallel beta-helix repeat protein
MRWLGIVVIVMLLAACGGDDDSDAPEATPTSGTGAATASSGADASPTGELTCGQEITESVTLTSDMDCDPVALIVTGDNVVLDLGGHTISGPGPGRRSWPLPNFNVAGVIVRGDNVTVQNGTIDTSAIGLLVDGASGGTFSNLRTVGNYYGLYLYEGGQHTVTSNAVRDNVYGLHLQKSHGNTLHGNDLSLQTHHSPGGYGLYLYASNDNLIEGNTIQENLNWGLWFSDSTGNTIVRNNVIGNDPQVSDDSGGNIYFDEETREGNYWSDYAGSDANDDGIGDVPYAIGGPGRSADPYPFVAQDGWSGRTTTTRADPTPLPPPGSPPRFYVALDERVAAIDPVSGALLAEWDVSLMGSSLAISPDGTRLYGISGDAAEASNVVANDTNSGEVVERWEVPGAQVVAATYDGERVLVSTPEGLTEIVLDTGELRHQPDGANAVAITPSWKHNLALVTDNHWMVSVIYLPDQHSPYAFKLVSKPLQVVDNRAGTRLFVVLESRNYVSVIDTEQFLETDTVPLHDIAPENARIAPAPDGTTLYVLDRANARLIAVDLGTKEITADVTLTGTAIDLSVSANGDWVGVALRDGNRLAIFDANLGARSSVELTGTPSMLIAPH